ncbi:MAG: hypothetical protein SH809_01210 [Rhodothermales bacterium]|nr:hypothetical protein [Rhodothermales bacterium]
MQFIFDHIASVLVASVVIMIFAMLQLRGSQTLSETTIHQIVYSDALSAGRMIQRDLENMRTEEQTTEAIVRGVLSGGSAYTCVMTASGDTTLTLTFPTLTDPEGVSALVDPMDAPVQIVSYFLEAVNDSVAVDKGASTIHYELYRLNRIVGGTFTGGTKGNVVHFSVGLASKGSSLFTTASTTCPVGLSTIRFELKIAIDGITHVAGDQRSTSQLNLSRYATTVDLTNWE